MAKSDLIASLAPSVAGNVGSYALGYVHGKNGDMPRLGAKKDADGKPVLDANGNQQGGVPVDFVVGAGGYVAAGLMSYFGKGWVSGIGASTAARVGDAGSFYFTASMGGKAGQKARKAKKPDGTTDFTGTSNDRTILAGERRRRQIAESNARVQSAPQTQDDPFAAVMGNYGR